MGLTMWSAENVYRVNICARVEIVSGEWTNDGMPRMHILYAYDE